MSDAERDFIKSEWQSLSKDIASVGVLTFVRYVSASHMRSLLRSVPTSLVKTSSDILHAKHGKLIADGFASLASTVLVPSW